MHVLIKRKLEGPSIPELGQPTSTTFDSVTVPVARPSTGPAALASYELQRSLDGTTWSTIATGPSIFGNPAAQYVDGGRAALTTYYYRARATDVAGRVSDYCAPVSGTTVGNAMPAVMNTRFVDSTTLSWLDITDRRYSNGTTGTEHRLDGADKSTGQTFSAAGPMLWGRTSATPVLQSLATNPRTVFARSITADGLQITRLTPTPPNINWQSVYRIFPEVPFSQQGMIYIRGKIKLPATPLDANLAWIFAEVKVNGLDQKLQFDIQRDVEYNRGWVCNLGQMRRGVDVPFDVGIYNLWGTAAGPGGPWTPRKDTSPKQSGYFQQTTSNPDQSSTYWRYGAFEDAPGPGPEPDWDKWYTYEFACRMESPNGVVAGNAPQGWVWCATAVGSTTEPPPNREGTQRFYLTGRNMNAEPVPAQTKDGWTPGTTIIFPFLHYTNADAATGLPITWRQIEVYDYWPDDASKHPADAI